MRSCLIVGAGIAGLSAALDLSRHGLRPWILEARNRIGGRILTTGSWQNPIELGAEFVHGQAKETLALLDEFRLPAYEIPDRHLFYKNGKFTELEDFWERVEPALRQLPKGRGDLSFANATRSLRLRRADKALAQAFVQGFHAADPERLSQKALAIETRASEEIEANKALRLLNGYSALVHELHRRISTQGCRVLLGNAVREVRWSRGRVELRTDTGRLSARAAIFTIPPLPLEALRFDPSLTTKKKALALLGAGAVIKVVVQFRRRFWEEQLGSFPGYIHSNERYFPTWWGTYPFRFPILTGWTGGPAAEDLSGLDKAAIRQIACLTLAKLFGVGAKRINEWAECLWIHDWQSDPASRMAYGYIRVGGIDAPSQLRRPVEGTLFFAGEATEGGGLGGTVESAIVSGRRAARLVLERLG